MKNQRRRFQNKTVFSTYTMYLSTKQIKSINILFVTFLNDILKTVLYGQQYYN